jgi:hypothetical protein
MTKDLSRLKAKSGEPPFLTYRQQSQKGLLTAIAPYQSETNADNEGGAEAEIRLSVLDDGS